MGTQEQITNYDKVNELNQQRVRAALEAYFTEMEQAIEHITSNGAFK